MNTPIIRLEIEHMRHSIHMVLTDQMVKFDEDVRACLDAEVTPKRIQEIVASEVQAVMQAAIKKEMEAYFNYGEGRDKILKIIASNFGKSK